MKIKYIIQVLIIGILMITISTCKKETIEKQRESVINEAVGIKINKEQSILDLDSINVGEYQTIDTIEYNNYKLPVYKLVIEGSTKEIDSIEPGTIINIPEGRKGGKLLFVLEIEDKSEKKGKGAITLKALQATLDMYFNYENAVLKFSTPDNRSKLNLDIPNKLKGKEIFLGEDEIFFEKELPGIIFRSKPDTMCILKMDTRLWESPNKTSFIDINGSFYIQPAIDLYMHYEPKKAGTEILEFLEAAAVPDWVLMLYKDKNYFLGNLKQLKTNLYADIDQDITLNIHLTDDFNTEEPYIIPIGHYIQPSIPVSAEIEVSFEIDFIVLGVVDLEININKKKNIAIGIDLDRDLPEPKWYYKSNEITDGNIILEAKVKLTAGIYLVLETEIYVMGIIGPELVAKAGFEAEASFGGTIGTNVESEAYWKIKADAVIKGDATLNLSAFHLDKATWKMWKMLDKLDENQRTYRKNIYLAPDHLVVESGDNQIGTFSQTLPFPIEIGAYDNYDNLISFLPVPLYIETNDGFTNLSGLIWTKNGKVSTSWTLGSENTEQELNIYFKDGDSKKGQIKVTAKYDSKTNIETGTMTDIDGNIYKTVKIGDQWWMAENIKVTHYPNGTAIPFVSNNPTWGDLRDNNTDDAYSYYNNNINGVSTIYGALYTYAAAIRLAPKGWHLPSEAEWITLENYINNNGYSGNEGIALKSLSRWRDGGNGTDNYGFSALPGGYRAYTHGGSEIMGHGGDWWSSTEYSSYKAYVCKLRYTNSEIGGYGDNKSYGLSIRCIRDDNPVSTTIKKGLVSYYNLTNDAFDSHGNNDGIIHGGITFNYNSASFDGNGDWIDLLPANQIPSVGTFSFWVKVDLSRSIQLFGSIYNPSGGKDGYASNIGTKGNLNFYCYQGNRISSRVETSSIVLANTWTHIVCSIDKDQLGKIYINGELVSEQNFAMPPNTHDTYLMLGRACYFQEYNDFLGLSKNMGIWDKTLTSEDVKYLYNYGQGRLYEQL